MFRATPAHHQEPKTALAASGFAYVKGYWTLGLLDVKGCWTLRLLDVKGCWTLRLLDADSVQQPQRPTVFHVCKTRGC